MFKLFTVFVLMLTLATAKEVPFTQEDRERLKSMEIKLEKLETKVDVGFSQIDKRFEQMERQTDRLIQIMIAIFGGQVALVSAVIGLLLWDRRTIVRKATDESIEKFEKGRFSSLLDALRELAKEDEKLYRVLRKYNLL